MQRSFARLIFLRRKIENQQAINARFARLAMELFEAELKNRIQVGVEHDRNLRASANLPNAIEHACHRGAGLERALRRELINETVRERIGKRKTKLDNIGPDFLEGEREIYGPGQIGIAGADVGDERRFIPLPKGGETLVDSVWHSR
jgi:hypothetical protein